MESGVDPVLGVFRLVSAIQVIQSIHSGVDRVAELVVFVNEHSISKITKYYLRG